MEGLKEKKYLLITKKRFDPIALTIAVLGLLYVITTLTGVDLKGGLLDYKSGLIVIGGTATIILFQFDLSSLLYSIITLFQTVTRSSEKKIINISSQLDDAIINGLLLKDLREGKELTGELLNDVVYMRERGLLFEEIDEFITSKIADAHFKRNTTVSMLDKAATISPALGLFGTVIGLIGVLKNLSSPDQIGPNMSLALLTTAYGTGLSTLILTPLAGRVEHNNEIFKENYKQILSKIGILLSREERTL